MHPATRLRPRSIIQKGDTHFIVFRWIDGGRMRTMMAAVSARVTVREPADPGRDWDGDEFAPKLRKMIER